MGCGASKARRTHYTDAYGNPIHGTSTYSTHRGYGSNGYYGTNTNTYGTTYGNTYG